MTATSRFAKILLGFGLSLVISAVCHVAVQVLFGYRLWTWMLVTSSATKSFLTAGIVFSALAVFPMVLAITVAWLLLRKKYPEVSKGMRWGYVFAPIVFLLQMQPILKADTSIGPIQRTYRAMELGDPSNCTEGNLKDITEDITESNIGRCFAAVAVKRLDTSYCDLIPEGTTERSKGILQSEKHNCYFDIAVAANNSSLCDRLSDAEMCKKIVKIRWERE